MVSVRAVPRPVLTAHESARFTCRPAKEGGLAEGRGLTRSVLVDACRWRRRSLPQYLRGYVPHLGPLSMQVMARHSGLTCPGWNLPPALCPV